MNEDITATRAFGLEEGEGEARRWLGVSLATIKATGKETGGPAGFEEFIYATSEPAKELTLPPPEGPPDEAEMEQLAASAASTEPNSSVSSGQVDDHIAIQSKVL